MWRIGPIVIARTREIEDYQDVVRAAWPLHRAIWFDQTHDYRELMPLDLDLSTALSFVPPEDEPTDP